MAKKNNEPVEEKVNIDDVVDPSFIDNLVMELQQRKVLVKAELNELDEQHKALTDEHKKIEQAIKALGK